MPLLVGELHPEHQPAAPGAPRGFGTPSSSCLAGSPSDIVARAYGRVVSSKQVIDTISTST